MLTFHAAASPQKRIRSSGVPNNRIGLLLRCSRRFRDHLTKSASSKRRCRSEQSMCATGIYIHGHHCQRHCYSLRWLCHLGRIFEQAVGPLPLPTSTSHHILTCSRLGLRSVAAKTMLLLCDLYFIVFSASNLSLAFSALFDESWACFVEGYQEVGDVFLQIPRTCPNNASICSKQKALSGVLIISLVAWLLCFSISVLRVVEKLRLEY